MSTTIVDVDSVVTVDSVTAPSYVGEEEKIYHALSYGGGNAYSGTASPSFSAPASSKRVRLGKSVPLLVRFSDSANGDFSWKLYSNGSSLASGVCSCDSEIAMTWTPENAGTFSLSLQAGTVTVSGPTISVIDWRDFNAA